MSSASSTFPNYLKHKVKASFPSKSAQPLSAYHEPDEPPDDFADPNVYLLQIAMCQDNSKLAVSTSNKEIKLYSSDKVQLVTQISGHSAPITDIQFSSTDINLLYSSSEDGTVALWDVRSPQKPANYWKGKGDILRCLAEQEQSLAAGSAKGEIYLWDVRNNIAPQILEDYFSEELTQLKFRPEIPHGLIAGSEDGVIVELDISIALGDDAVLNVINTENSIAKLGFFGSSNQYLYALSPTEQLQFWNLQDGTKLFDYGHSLRDSLASLWIQDVDYIINCQYNNEADQLFLLSGNFAGSVFVNSVDSQFQCHALETLSAHSAIARDVYMEPHGAFAVTVGEDSLLCLWSNDSNSSTTKVISHTPTYSVSQREKPY